MSLDRSGLEGHGRAVDVRLAWHDRRVAEAAAAWLAEPRDTQAYTRLVAAAEARRAYLHPQLGDVEELQPVPAPQMQPDELLDELAESSPPEQLGPVTRQLRARLENGRAGPYAGEPRT